MMPFSKALQMHSGEAHYQEHHINMLVIQIATMTMADSFMGEIARNSHLTVCFNVLLTSRSKRDNGCIFLKNESGNLIFTVDSEGAK